MNRNELGLRKNVLDQDFYITTEYNNPRIIPDIFKQTPRNKEICNTSNVWFNHEDIVMNFFMIRKQNSRKKYNQNKRVI